MKLAFLHISDIHLRKKSDPIFGKISKIGSALQSIDPDIDLCIVIASGDITNSGSTEEYKVASYFFSQLDKTIKSEGIAQRTEFVVAPGNHDCNFRRDTKTRDVLIKSLGQDESTEIDESVIDNLTSIQQEFFTFAVTLMPNINFTGNDKLSYTKSIKLNKYTVAFNCYNSACVSRSKEKQGDIFIPLTNKTEQSGDLACAIFHHPYNWFRANDSKSFRRYIERKNDIVFTGHEHDPDQYSIKKYTGEISEYFEGVVLQDEKDKGSCFNVVIADLQNRKRKLSQYSWDGQKYIPVIETDWEIYQRSKFLKQDFEINSDFKDSLNDIGSLISHRRKDDLTLRDLFIYPDLKEVSPESGEYKVPFKTIRSNKFIEYVLRSRRLIIIGPSLSGKTSTLKTAYLDLLDRGLVPLLLNGDSINSIKPQKIRALINDSFTKQYSGDKLEDYKQCRRNLKVLLIDDLDKSELNSRGKGLFLSHINKLFDKIVISGSEFLRYEEITSSTNGFMLSFTHCEISEFALLLRGKLIEKWVRLGQEYTESEESITHQIKTRENLITSNFILRILPSYPIVIITILQAIDAKIPLQVASGSYGHIHQFLLKQAIARASKTAEDTDINFTFLSELAYHMFSERNYKVSDQKIEELCEIYNERHDITIHPQDIIPTLLKARALRKEDNYYRFRYPYIYHYFTAMFLSENFRRLEMQDNVRASIEIMSKNLYKQEYSNIILFLSYLSKDQDILNIILRNAGLIFEEYRPCDLDKDVDFLNKMGLSEPQFSLEERPIKERREELLSLHDEITGEFEAKASVENIKYDKQDVNDISKLDFAMKMSQALGSINILGQILRNFPGSSLGIEKTRLVESCCHIGLRATKALLKNIEEKLGELHGYIADFIRDDLSERGEKQVDERKIAKRTSTFIYAMAEGLVFGIIKLISSSIGSERFKKTYKKVFQENDETPFLFIDISIKLDYFKGFPQEEVLSLYKNIRKNAFGTTLLRLLVIHHMLMYVVSIKLMQSLLAKLKIDVEIPRLLLPPKIDKQS